MDAADTSITAVTVYASGARVTRTGRAPATAGTRIAIAGLPLALVDDTVRAQIAGGATIRAIHVHTDAPATSLDDAEPEISAELRAARRATALATGEAERIAGAIAELTGDAIAERETNDREASPAWGDVLAARRALIAMRAARELALREEQVAAVRATRDAAEAEAVIADRDRRLGTTRAPKLHELRKRVELELDRAPAANAEITIEYAVAAARWAPTYVARLEGDHARFEIRAVVAQDTGEAWTGVALALSTAEPTRFAPLPELAAQRIGRRQDAPAKSGFRAPPTGARSLYADYEHAFPVEIAVLTREPERPPADTIDDLSAVALDGAGGGGGRRRADTFAEEVWDEGSSRAKEAFHTPPAGSPPVNRRQSRGAAPEMKKSAPAPTMLAAMKPQAQQQEQQAYRDEPQQAPAPSVPRLDYANLRMAPPASHERGQLVAARAVDEHADAIAGATSAAALRLARLALPPGCTTTWLHSYDYAFAADGKLDVAADGAWCSVPLVAKPCTVKVRHVAVPREQADAFRVAAIANPFVAPLLPGPIDVYDRGQFLLTSHVEFTAPGGSVDVGLGVDPAVKIARNIEFREEIGGVLRGRLALHHAIAIDIDNRGTRAVELEVRERVPVARVGDDDVEVAVGRVEPPWDRWTPDPDAPADARLRGGYRWKVSLPPGKKTQLRAAYEVKIGSKYELVGGNRRDA